MALLSIRDLTAKISGKSVICDLSCQISRGQVVVLTGANGSGKSSLSNVLMGNKQYLVEKGKITFLGKGLLSLTPDERARLGLFVSWQQPIFIPGVSIFTLCKTAYESIGNKIDSVVKFKKKLENLAESVGLTKEHVVRAVNEGFSGGEKKRFELLQLMLLAPKLAILDEIDSGLDTKGRDLTVKVVKEMRKHGTAFIVISHYEGLIKAVEPDEVWEMRNGFLQTRI